MTLYNIAMLLVFVLILMLTHIVFKNGRMLCLWSCKLIVATYIWALVWIITQLDRLPEWNIAFKESIEHVTNGTLFRQFQTSL